VTTTITAPPEVPDRPEPPASPGEGRTGSTTTVHDVARTVAAVAMLGAAIIHFAFAPDHMDEQTSHGAFFLGVGWLQLLVAGALAFRLRPQRAWLLGTAGLGIGVAAVWLLTRTAGLPGEDTDAVGFADTLASVLEVAAAALALSLAFGWLADRAVRRPSLALTGVPALALVGLVTASVVPSLGGGHGHGDGGAGGNDDGHAAGGDHGAGGDMAADHHDGAAAPADWDAQRIAALSGNLPDDEVARLRQANMDHLAEEIRARSDELRSLPEAEREAIIADFVAWSVDHALEAEAPPADGQATMHSHGITQWQAITDPAEQVELQDQLEAAGTIIPEVRTAADAVDNGYVQVTPYVPGIGAHYLHIGRLTDGEFNPAEPEMLLYNGNEPTSELVGLSYGMLAEEPPEGFVGPNDEWHVHPSLCIIGTMVVGPDSTPADMCASVGGRKGMGFDHPMWMGHLWQVPGWESPWGLFSGENPTINLATTDVGR
jgi:hypothetical protein